jgi:mRNA interferase HicA
LKRRDIIKKLESAGYHMARDDGNHTVYERPGSRPVQVPRHREVNENTAKTILKIAGVK